MIPKQSINFPPHASESGQLAETVCSFNGPLIMAPDVLFTLKIGI